MSAAETRMWPSMAFEDVDAMTQWLAAVGFTEHATYRDDTGTVAHAEWLWPDGGGIMFGAVREGGAVKNPGGSAIYLVVDDPDAVCARAIAAGGTEVLPVTDQDYGGRDGSLTDPEGNFWSFGSYQPE
jgi:uncharacterized glyoxalase superfamily protein PhnB